MDLYRSFTELALARSELEYSALRINSRRRDFLAKDVDGRPVFLLHDGSQPTYAPRISLKNISAQFHVTCRVTTQSEIIEDQFGVVDCDSSAQELHELFIRCFEATVAELPDAAATRDLEHCVYSLLDLFSTLNRPSVREIIGLWAELFVIASCPHISEALTAWHADRFERVDFSWADRCLEVKASTGDARSHEFGLHQLQVSGLGFVASVLLGNPAVVSA